LEGGGGGRWVGREWEGERLARPQEGRRAYIDALTKHSPKLEEIADANRCEHLRCDTSRRLGEALADYLQKRSLVARR